jgi:preprotein translocase subunit SecA
MRAQDVDKMRHAVGLKAYSSQQPLDEFRLEANREFLLLLSTYRDAVVARLMVPDLNFSLLLGQQQAEELVGAEVATGADAAATAAQQAGQQQQQQQGQQAPVGAQQQPSPQQAAAVGAVPVNGSSSSNGHAAAQPQPSPAGNKAPAATSAGNTSSS